MFRFSKPSKLAFAVFVGLSILALAVAPGSFTRSAFGTLIRDRRGEGHHYSAPTESDSRSPCPALNVLANHGYLPRNGRNIGPFDLVYALQDAYRLDTTLSHVLAIGGFFLVHYDHMTDLPTLPISLKDPAAFLSSAMSGLGSITPTALEAHARQLRDWALQYIRYRSMDLHHIGLHNHIEHDASITHDDAPMPTSEFAPWRSNTSLFDAFMADAPGMHVDLTSIGTARVRREAETVLWSGRAIDALHAFIARGEAALVIGIFGETLPNAPPGVSHVGDHWDWTGLGVSKDTMRTFWLEERLPAGWKPVRTTSAKSTQAGNQLVGARMDQLRAEQAARVNATGQAVLTAH